MNNLLYLYRILLKNTTYNIIKPKVNATRRISGIVAPTSSVASIILALNTDLNMSIPLDLNILSNIIYLLLAFTAPEYYTKDINNIISIYKDIVKSYVELNDKLDLKKYKYRIRFCSKFWLSII